jgi:WD40 repeat protein
MLDMPDDLDAVAVSPDGKMFATGRVSNEVQCWDAVTGEPVGKRMHTAGQVLALAFSPDGKVFLTGSGATQAHKGQIQLWDAATGDTVGLPADLDEPVSAAAFSPDGSRFVTVLGSWITEGKGALQFWNAADGRPAGPTGRDQGIAELTETATGRPLGAPLLTPYPLVRAIAFSPDGRKVAAPCTTTNTRDCTARVWDGATGVPLTPEIPQPNIAIALAFSRDSKVLATGDYSLGVNLWNAADGQRIGQALSQRDIVLSLVYSPDGKTLVAGTAND